MSVKLASALVPPAMTTTQRDAIPAGRRPPGSMIWNTTTSRVEINAGSDATPAWRGLPVGSADIMDGSIVDADVAAAGVANISGGKLADISIDYAKLYRAYAYGCSATNSFNAPSQWIQTSQYLSGGTMLNVQYANAGVQALYSGLYLCCYAVECTTAAPQVPLELWKGQCNSGTKLMRSDGAWSAGAAVALAYFNNGEYWCGQFYQASGSQQTYTTRAWMVRVG
jgi:hypothetical protein